MQGVHVSIRNVTKRFESVVAVDDLSLDIPPGELFTLLGPSGCGKTTLLRTIAGFYAQDAGSIHFDDRRIDGVPPHRRETGMVFQSYAVFPFMSVYDNVAYGLKARRVHRKEIRERVAAALELVRLDGLESRRPEQLSGGQQQRVAVARALVIEPRVLLMDEPLSNLDAKLRVEMRMDIRRLQKRFQTTMIYVTHDQEEALAISDRIAVMELGRVVQVGTPWEIYHRPANPYAAGFIGVTNFFSCPLLKMDGRSETVTIDFQGKSLELPYIQSPESGTAERGANDRLIVSMRPESLDIFEEDAEMPADFVGFRGTVLESTFLGPVLRIAAEAESGERFQIEQNNPDYDDLIEEGSRITVGCPAREMTVFPEEG